MPPDALPELHPTVEIIVAVAVVAGAITAILGLLYKVGRIIHRVFQIVDRELNPNGGSSIRDQVVRIAHQTDTTARRVGSMANDMQQWHARADREHADLWAALAELGYDRRQRGE